MEGVVDFLACVLDECLRAVGYVAVVREFERSEHIEEAKDMAAAFVKQHDAERVLRTAQAIRQLGANQPNPDSNPVASQQVMVRSAVEAAGLEEATRRLRDFVKVEETLNGAAAHTVTRNLALAAASDVDDKITSRSQLRRFFVDTFSLVGGRIASRHNSVF